MTDGEPRRDDDPTRRGTVRSAVDRPVTDGGPSRPRLFDAFPHPLVRYETERDAAVIRAVNPAFERTFGVEGSTITDGRLVDHLLVEAADGEPDASWASVDATDETVPTDDAGTPDAEANGEDVLARLDEGERVTVRFRRGADGERRYFRLEAFPAPNEDTDGYVVYTDVTDSERRARTLKTRADRLERVASVTAHDLRNPLEVAKIRLEAARDTGEDVHFEKVERALDRIQWISQDVLSVGGGVEPTDAVAPEDVAEAAWSTVETADATLVLEDDLPTIEADADSLRHVFENLFRNAVEHGSTSSRSETDDAVEHGSRGVTVTVGGLADGFYVADDGPGVPPTERDRAFEYGYSTKDDDAGLGLTIVQQIAEAHGWQVTLTSGDGAGARFEFTGVELD